MRDYTASLSYAVSSPLKMQIPAKLVRGKNTKDALTLLQFLPKKAGHILAKVIKSAHANAKSAEGDQVETVISAIEIGKGPHLKRMRFASRARIHGYQKYRSFVKVVLSVK